MTEEKNDKVLLDTLQAEYPEVFDSAIRSRVIKHSIMAYVHTETDEPVTARARRLSTAKYRALQGETSVYWTRAFWKEVRVHGLPQ